MTDVNSSVMALDVGDRRIGVAIARLTSRLPEPWGVIDRADTTLLAVQELIKQEQTMAIVVGLPRGMDGQETAQTKQVRQFATELKKIGLPIYLQDEALTSHQAKEELNQRGTGYNKGAIDALAATYILSDFLREHQELAGNVDV